MAATGPISKPRLTTLKPQIRMATQGVAPQRSGDARIRGSALQAIRHRILTRACGLCECERCKATGAVRIATIIDHIVPLWAGGRESDANRQAISRECHDLKSAAEAAQRAGGGRNL